MCWKDSSPVSDEMTEIKPIKEKLRIIETIASSTIKATDASTTQIASTSKVTSTTQIASTTQVLSASEEEEDIGDYVDPDPDDGKLQDAGN